MYILSFIDINKVFLRIQKKLLLYLHSEGGEGILLYPCVSVLNKFLLHFNTLPCLGMSFGGIHFVPIRCQLPENFVYF